MNSFSMGLCPKKIGNIAMQNKIALVLVVMLFGNLFSGEYKYDYRGEISLQGGGYSLFEDRNFYGGARIIPFFEGQKNYSDGSYLKLQLSVDAFSSYNNKWKNELELYRSTVSYQTLQTEIKVGLQKITFGPARYLRPLMWFDRINPTDPMQITKGVNAALFRYYTMNNTNFWIWGLYQNDELKGMEARQTNPDRPEWGGRVQIPLMGGEVGFSFHNRELLESRKQEHRFALDGHYDVGIGLWFESSINLHKDQVDRKMVTIGSDYTFGIGNGLNVVGEYMPIEQSNGVLMSKPDEHLLALSLSYPINIMDQVMYLTYYSESMDKIFHYLQYQRTYDRISANISLFYFPDVGYDIFTGKKSRMSGFGAQAMVIYNF